MKPGSDGLSTINETGSSSGSSKYAALKKSFPYIHYNSFAIF
jgi:hypothetical protein